MVVGWRSSPLAPRTVLVQLYGQQREKDGMTEQSQQSSDADVVVVGVRSKNAEIKANSGGMGANWAPAVFMQAVDSDSGGPPCPTSS